ncbi:hypothetical protein [Leptolyngbya sp. NIES-2104]|uniref:hypothetical protein n=1 Tax=Leptolyngbya sp. NIES-2104 TaxID=1552121 RepID=UPI0006EC7C34|nr:hypothetical protein [Leptolyngbya sp. NIES-2104]GAP99082.1 hypothetical protein NIES2104_56390 [Leptolyngbya sp. NIES-2104]
MARKKSKEEQEQPDWQGARAELAFWAETPKETPLEKFVREEFKMFQMALSQGYTFADIASWLKEKKVPGAYSKSVAAAIKKVEAKSEITQLPAQLFTEISSSFLLGEPQATEINSQKPYLLKGKEACKIVIGLETQPEGKIQFRILGDEDEKNHAIKTENMVKNLRGPIEEKDLNAIAAKLAKIAD